MKYSDLWLRRDTEGERHVIEHIRRNGYITQETLGDICETHGIGDRVPCMGHHYEYMREMARRRRFEEWRREHSEDFYPNVTQRHNPDF